MTPDEQEALSHQALGHWCVPLENGGIAVFSHPSGRLERIVWNELLWGYLKDDRDDALQKREEAKKQEPAELQLNLEGIDL